MCSRWVLKEQGTTWIKAHLLCKVYLMCSCLPANDAKSVLLAETELIVYMRWNLPCQLISWSYVLEMRRLVFCIKADPQ